MTDAEYRDLVKGVAWLTRSDLDRAEDAVQQAYVEMLGKDEEIRDEKTFLFTVARRRLWDRLRKETFLPMAYDEDDNTPILDRVAGGIDPADMFIGEPHALMLRCIAEGMTVSEAADLGFGGSRFKVYKILEAWEQG